MNASVPPAGAAAVPLVATALTGMPEVPVGADLPALLVAAAAQAGAPLTAGRVLVVSSKVLSKAAGLWAEGDRADVVASQTRRVVAERDGAAGVTQIVESVAGPVMAAAGVDASNTGGREALLLLPADPDASARVLRAALLALVDLPSDTAFGVIASDTAGRPWRAGQTDFALGSAGVLPLLDHRGGTDHDGRPLAVTARCLVDQLAAMADLVKGKADGIPAAVVSGCPYAWFEAQAPGAASVLRTGPEDWFALGHHEAVRAALGVAPGSATARRVGRRSTAPETQLQRIDRALRVARHGEPFAGEVRVSLARGPVVTLTAASERALGRALARLEVALHGEGLDPTGVAVDARVDQPR